MNLDFSRRPLEELALSVDYGLTAPANPANIGPRFLRITDIQDDRVDWATVPFCEATAAEEETARLENGDIVFARTGATTGKSYLLRKCPERAVFASYLIRVRPNRALVEPRYLSWFFQTPDYWRQITSSASGTAQPGVNATKLKALQVPTPQLPEQRRIADILDKADAIRRKRKEAIALTDELLRSAFLEMFGDPVSNPKGWPLAPLENVVNRIVVGHVGPTSHGYAEVGIPFLRTQNVRPMFLDVEDVRFITREFNAELSKSTIRRGDVLVSRVGANRGMAAVVPESLNEANCANIIVITPGERLTSEYLAYIVNSPRGASQLVDVSVGSAQGVINVGALKRWVIPLPTVAAQSHFSSVVRSTILLQVEQKSAVGASEILFNSLVDRAFRGNLFEGRAC